jgi:hypothetical protein
MLSQQFTVALIPQDLYNMVVAHLTARLGTNSVRAYGTMDDGEPVPAKATFFDYVVISQRRYWAQSRTANKHNAHVAVATGHRTYRVGHLVSIFAFPLNVATCPFVRLGLVHFLLPSNVSLPAASSWNSV